MDCEQVVPELGEKTDGNFVGTCSTYFSEAKSSQDAIFELLNSQLTLKSPSSGTFCRFFPNKPPVARKSFNSSERSPTNTDVEVGENISDLQCRPSQWKVRVQDEFVQRELCQSSSKRRKTSLNSYTLSKDSKLAVSNCEEEFSATVPSPTSRYKSPLRRGNWHESWESARSLGACSVHPGSCDLVISRVKHVISMIIQRNTCLLLSTVDKWLTLLCDFIEFNADEYILFLIMVKKYLVCNGQLQSLQDSIRPQKWERVLAICAYFVVFLSEEFAGRTRRDLEDLMGPAFHFGEEQFSFLSVIDWKVNVTCKEFQTIHDLILLEGNEYKFHVWKWLGFPLSELDPSGELFPYVALRNTKRNAACLIHSVHKDSDKSERYLVGNNEKLIGKAQGKEVPILEPSESDCFGSSDSLTKNLITCDSEEYQRVPC